MVLLQAGTDIALQSGGDFPIWIFVVLMSLTFLVVLFEKRDVSAVTFRQKQAEEFAKQDTLKQKMIDYTTEKVEYSKRLKIEILCQQAGKDMLYGEYILQCIFTGIGAAIVIGFIFSNPFMGLLFLFLGMKFPKQMLLHKKNKRLKALDQQLGPFMYMTIKRYETTRDFAKAIEATANEFRGVQPLYGELQKTVSEINVKIPVADAISNLAKRSNNQYVARLADYYTIAAHLGTDEVRKKLLMQAYLQYEENRKLKEFLKKEISEPVRDAQILLVTVPMMFLFGAFVMPGYLDFMLHTTMGRIGVAFVTMILLGCMWFINAKIAAPID